MAAKSDDKESAAPVTAPPAKTGKAAAAGGPPTFNLRNNTSTPRGVYALSRGAKDPGGDYEEGSKVKPPALEQVVIPPGELARNVAVYRPDSLAFRALRVSWKDLEGREHGPVLSVVGEDGETVIPLSDDEDEGL